MGTSLAVVFFNALSGTIAYIRQKKVYYDAAIRFSVATLPGAILGSYFSYYFTSRIFYISFGVLLIIIAGLLYLRGRADIVETSDVGNLKYNRTLGMLMSVLVGFLSSIFGIGGGIIHVPTMICLLGFPTHVATATSHFVLVFSAFFGVLSYYFWGQILVTPAIVIGIGSILGAQLGAYLSLKTKAKSITILLCIALVALGIRMIIGNR